MTVKSHKGHIRRFFESVEKSPSRVMDCDIREYFKRFVDSPPNSYANVLKSLKVFFRDFINMPQVVSSFKFPRR